MQRAILSLPGSDGLMNLHRMLAQLWVLFPKPTREAFIKEVGKSLLKLSRLGDLYLEQQYGNQRRCMTIDEWADLSLLNFVAWDGDTQQWTMSARRPGVQEVFVQLSHGGINDLRLYEAPNKGTIIGE